MGDGLDPEELEERRWSVAQVRHSSEMEGGGSGPEARALQDRWAKGEISGDDLVRLTRELHQQG